MQLELHWSIKVTKHFVETYNGATSSDILFTRIACCLDWIMHFHAAVREILLCTRLGFPDFDYYE